MSTSVGIVPVVLLPLAFLFVLLIILIVKAPKVGAWVVGGVVLLSPLVLFRFARGGLPAHPDAGALIILPGAFLFVLLIILLTRAPKAGAALVVALVVMGLMFGTLIGTHRSAPHALVVPQEALIPSAVAVEPPALPNPSSSAAPPAPIWSSGVDMELDADVYPSALAAARAAGTPLAKSIRELAPDPNTAPKVVVFQEAHPYPLIAELRDAVRRALPNVSCNIESEARLAQADELVVTLYRREADTRPAPWVKAGETVVRRSDTLVQYQPGQPVETFVASGQLDFNLSGRQGKVRLAVGFTEKPWMEDFATFASIRPERAFIIARSRGACTSEGEAHQQALDDARARLTEAISQQGGRLSDKLPKPQITATDVLQGGFIVDRFAQSLAGSTARIWRQALLLDVSGPKLAQLTGQKAREFRQVKTTWARMGFSALGVLVLIGVIYFFLNMATMGYYEWSLRIACVVLAIVGVLSILMVVH